MRYNDIAREHLKKYKRIIVTGPQRSGTTIAGNILARDLGYAYIDEKHVGNNNLTRLIVKLRRFQRFVIQVPCFASIIHWIHAPSTLVIFMRRDPAAIKASQDRIKWGYAESERVNYFRDEGDIADVRYECWDRFQKSAMRMPYIELDYDSLEGHPLWMEKDTRNKFKPKQVSVSPIKNAVRPIPVPHIGKPKARRRR